MSESFIKKRKGKFSVPFALFYILLYFGWSLILSSLIKQPVLAMIIANTMGAAGYFVCKHFDSDRELVIRNLPSLSDINNGFLVFILAALTVLVFLCVQIFSISMPELITKNFQLRETAILTVGHHSLMYILLSVVFAPLCEECIFRGMVFPVFNRRFGLVFSVFVSSVLFAVLHGTLLHMITAPLVGILCALAFYLTDDVFYSIFVHSFYNFLLIMAMFAEFQLPVVDKPAAVSFLLIGYLVVVSVFVYSKRKSVLPIYDAQ